MESEINILSSIIQRRRSIFPPSYTQEEIPEELITRVLESANYAPTHKLTQPWRFIVYRNEGKRKLGEELARLYKQETPAAQFLQKKYEGIVEKAVQSSCVIVLNAQLHPDLIPEWEEIAAFACAVQNMALTAEALKIGAYWSSPGMISQLNEYLELKPNEKCFGLFYMGFHNEEPRLPKRTPMAEKVRWIND
ncbi:nitroreductase [Pedobacter cryoconitis]|uniref:Nitroreductase n=1 Tax=Pedobacter cryoconitis TaxID=188932 RepID=A0A7W9DXL2_9SPHI|nr:nitroreductase [Pedobacter cryoconitis]MBB5634284.1 nitroreductase [Pedobacter cryoconitis]MBB6272590.1 nitroreductase [Pedobacter cryoconitis]